MSARLNAILGSDTARVAEAKPACAPRRGDAGVCVVLAGGLAPAPLAAAMGRSVLDANLSASATVLGAWITSARRAGFEGAVRVAHGGDAPAPVPGGEDAAGSELIEDAEACRGPAGALRDAWHACGEPGEVLVVEGNRFAACGLRSLVAAHRGSGVDVTVGVNPDRSPAGVYLARGEAIAAIARVGYVDIKEQWLPRVRGEGFGVRGCVLAGAGTLPLRTLPQFLEAARLATGSAGQLRVVCPGAVVERETDLVDSVVMPGGVVERGAVVARSLVLPGAHVRGDEVLVDGVARRDGGRGSCGAGGPAGVHVSAGISPLGHDDIEAAGASVPGPGLTQRLAA